jgi:hypothetical protein
MYECSVNFGGRQHPGQPWLYQALSATGSVLVVGQEEDGEEDEDGAQDECFLAHYRS